MISEPSGSKYLHVKHSSVSQNKGSPGLLDKPSWSGEEFEQISVLLYPNLPLANHNTPQWLEILKNTIKVRGKTGKIYLDTMIQRGTC